MTMVERRTCDYTGRPIEPGTGIMYVRTDGTVLHFVDSKAEKNYLLGREPRDLGWTEAGRTEKATRLGAAAGNEPDTTEEEELESQDTADESIEASVDSSEKDDTEADDDEVPAAESGAGVDDFEEEVDAVEGTGADDSSELDEDEE